MWFYIGPRFSWGWPGNRVRSGQSNKNSRGLLLSSFLKSQNWPIFTIQSRSHVLALHMCRSAFHLIFYFRLSSCWPACVISASAAQMSNSKLNANSDRKFRTYFYIAMQIFALQSSLFLVYWTCIQVYSRDIFPKIFEFAVYLLIPLVQFLHISRRYIECTGVFVYLCFCVFVKLWVAPLVVLLVRSAAACNREGDCIICV